MSVHELALPSQVILIRHAPAEQPFEPGLDPSDRAVRRYLQNLDRVAALLPESIGHAVQSGAELQDSLAGTPPALFIHSGFVRTAQTTDVLLGSLPEAQRPPVIKDDRLREGWSGEASPMVVKRQAYMKAHPDEAKKYAQNPNTWRAPGGGENNLDIAERLWRVVESAGNIARDKVVVLVTHGRVQIASFCSPQLGKMSAQTMRDFRPPGEIYQNSEVPYNLYGGLQNLARVMFSRHIDPSHPTTENLAPNFRFMRIVSPAPLDPEEAAEDPGFDTDWLPIE